MARVATHTLEAQHRSLEWAKQVSIIVGASLFVALCARVTIPLLPFTPVPLTLQNFGVLVGGLTLGSRRGFAALALYLIEGASGLPVFNPAGPGGMLQLLGPTGGYLMAYPFVAFVAGWIFEHSSRRFFSAALASLAGEIVLFAAGLSWLYTQTHSLTLALRIGLYWFVFAEVIKILMAAGVGERGRKWLAR